MRVWTCPIISWKISLLWPPAHHISAKDLICWVLRAILFPIFLPSTYEKTVYLWRTAWLWTAIHLDLWILWAKEDWISVIYIIVKLGAVKCNRHSTAFHASLMGGKNTVQEVQEYMERDLIFFKTKACVLWKLYFMSLYSWVEFLFEHVSNSLFLPCSYLISSSASNVYWCSELIYLNI